MAKESNKKEKKSYRSKQEYVMKNLRLKPEIWQKIVERMDKHEVENFTQFALDCMLEKEIIMNKFSFTHDKEVVKGFKKIGTNINQIAYQMNVLAMSERINTVKVEELIKLFQSEMFALNQFIRDNKIQ